MKLWRALKAAWRAFVVEWKSAPVPVLTVSTSSSHPVRYQVIRKVDDTDVLVYNEFNGGEASRLFCAERDNGLVAEFWMQTPQGWIRRDWSPR